MKIPNRNFSKSGFTLVELLVVIAIIAVLAAAGFAGGNAAIQKARKVTAQSVASTVELAVEQFYSDYSALPDPTGSDDDDTEYATDETNGVRLLNILAGKESTPIQNDRKIRYLSLKEGKGGRDGADYDANGSFTGLFDPWGEPYRIVIDYNYNEVLEFTVPELTNTPPDGKLNGRRVAVYSLGTDSAADANSKTLVKTW